MRKILALMLVLMLMMLTAGCGGTDSADTEDTANTANDTEITAEAEENTGAEDSAGMDFTAENLAAKIAESVEFSDYMEPVSESIVYDIYGIDQAIVAECCSYFSTGATAEEITVVTVNADNAEENKSAVSKAYEDRVAAQIESFTDYVPGELDKLKDPLIMEVGNTVVLVVCDDTSKAKDVIVEYVK